jgi:hypothetical protein
MNRRYLLLVLSVFALLTLPELKAQQPTRPRAKKPAAAAKPAQTKETDAPVKEDLKRIILKDGSYQPVMKYQVIGDRLHYLSAERNEWEDIPISLIDWEASRKYAAEAAAENRPHAHEVDAEEAKERAEEEAKTPTVSPGIRLPLTGGIWLLDVYQGKPELNELVQNGADVNKNTAANILRGAINPIASSKQTVELKGLHARVQSHVGDPFIYIALDQDPKDAANSPDPDVQKKRWRIVRTEEKKGNRIVGNVNVAFYGKMKEKAYYVEAEVTPVSGPWFKVVPAQKLQPGEYALVEMLGPDGMNRFVWDFGVNPEAPLNPGAWKAAPAKVNASGDATPKLTDRKP